MLNNTLSHIITDLNPVSLLVKHYLIRRLILQLMLTKLFATVYSVFIYYSPYYYQYCSVSPSMTIKIDGSYIKKRNAELKFCFIFSWKSKN